jgi:DNA-binding transcriptional LysR family regulator
LAFYDPIKNAVAAGMGVAIVSRLIVSLEVQAGTLGIILLRDLSILRPLRLQRVRGRSLSPSLWKSSGSEFRRVFGRDRRFSSEQ